MDPNVFVPQFIATWNNKFVDYDGYYGAQCVDIIQEYSKELGGPRFSGNAADIINQPGSFYTRLASGPQIGDIVVFARTADNGNAGHIAIFLGDYGSYFISFDQNFPTGTACHRQIHPYYNILGYLRPNVFTKNTADMPIAGATTQEWSIAAIQQRVYAITGNLHTATDIAKNHLGKTLGQVDNDFFASQEYGDSINRLYQEAYGHPCPPADLAGHRAAHTPFLSIVEQLNTDRAAGDPKLQTAKAKAQEIVNL